jgi:ATP-dependent RNA helicase
MESDRVRIDKNFDFGTISSYDELDLKKEVRLGLKEREGELPLLHVHCLRALLSRQSIVMQSPPATGKGSLLAIGLLQLLDFKKRALQFIVLEAKEHLVKETAQSLMNFAYCTPVKFCVADSTTQLREDYKPFASCQVAVLSRYKMIKLLENARRDYNALRFVVLDAIVLEDPKVAQIMEILQCKAPNVVFWWFNSRDAEVEERERFIERFMTGALRATIVFDHRNIASLSHLHVMAQSQAEKVELIKRILDQSVDYQKIVFCRDTEKALEYRERLDRYRPAVISDERKVSQEDEILREFSKGVHNVLVCVGIQYFARRIKTKAPTYVIVAEVVDVDAYEVITRRAGMGTNDRVYVFTENNDQAAVIEALSEKYDIKFSAWPNAND